MAEGIILPGPVLVRLQRRYSRECTVNNLVEGAAGRGSCWGQSGFLLRQRSVDTQTNTLKCSAFPLIAHKGGDSRQKESQLFWGGRCFANLKRQYT